VNVYQGKRFGEGASPLASYGVLMVLSTKSAHKVRCTLEQFDIIGSLAFVEKLLLVCLFYSFKNQNLCECSPVQE